MGLDPEFIGDGTGHKVWFTGKCKNPAGFVFLRFCFSVVSGKIGTLVNKLFSMRIIAPLFFFGLLCSFSATAQRELSAEEEAFFSRAMSQINAKHVRWIKSTAQEANQKNLSAEEVQVKTSSYGMLGSMGSQDIEALAFLVLMQASKSAQEDLKAIMAKVKSLNNQKSKVREAIAALNNKNSTITRAKLDSCKLLIQSTTNVQKTKTVSSSRAVTQSEINETITRLSDQRDSLSEMGEEQQLKLQMLLDRRSKLLSTLSNLMKKISQTQDSIIANLK